MSGELLRALRRGGAGAVGAARELVQRQHAGVRLSPAEVAELKALLLKPDVKAALGRDAFGALASLATPLGAPLVRDVKALWPDFAKLGQLAQLPERFAADVALLREALFAQPGLTRGQQAQRAMGFFAGYAAHALALAQAQGQPMPAETLRAFERALAASSYGALVEAGTGRTGVELALEWLGTSQTPAELSERAAAAVVDAPTWVDVPPAVELPKPAPAPVAARAGAPSRDEAPEPAPPPPPRARHGRLGPNLLWNALHLGRAEGEESEVERRDALNRLVVAAGLVLVFIGVVVVVLVWL